MDRRGRRLVSTDDRRETLPASGTDAATPSVRIRAAEADDAAFVLGLVPRLVAFDVPRWRARGFYRRMGFGEDSLKLVKVLDE